MGLDLWKGSVEHTQSTAATTWTITHGLAVPAPVVDVWVLNGNGDYEKILPANVHAPDTNTVVITFTQAMAGKAIVC